jgi:DNA-binding MarR family transcriptional regulator
MVRSTKPVFDLEAQHRDVEGKVVACLERLSRVLGPLLWDKARLYRLSPIQLKLLIHLYYHPTGRRRITYLAKEFNLTQATISDSVSALEAKGLVKRQVSPDDRRAIDLELTDRGRELALDLMDWADPLRVGLRSFTPKEKVSLMQALMKVISDLKRAGLIDVARLCITCRYFTTETTPGATTPYYCRLLDRPLAEEELRVDCVDHEAH